MTSAVGLMLIAAAHAEGWVVAEGGSQAIADALAADIERHGGRIETGVRVTSADDLPPSDVLMLDVSPSIAADILGDRLPASRRPLVPPVPSRPRRVQGRLRRSRAAFPGRPRRPARPARSTSAATSTRSSPTRHAVHRGAMPERPFVLVGQQYLADPTRSVGNVHPLWTYAHVPHGYTGDATEAIIAQIERFAPGFRERIVGTAVRSTTEMSVYNPNYVGGDVIGGASSLTPAPVPATVRGRPVLHRHPGHVPLLGVDPARGGRARDVRRQRRRSRPGPSARIGVMDRAEKPANRDGLAAVAIGILAAVLIAFAITQLV